MIIVEIGSALGCHLCQPQIQAWTGECTAELAKCIPDLVTVQCRFTLGLLPVQPLCTGSLLGVHRACTEGVRAVYCWCDASSHSVHSRKWKSRPALNQQCTDVSLGVHCYWIFGSHCTVPWMGGSKCLKTPPHFLQVMIKLPLKCIHWPNSDHIIILPVPRTPQSPDSQTWTAQHYNNNTILFKSY